MNVLLVGAESAAVQVLRGVAAGEHRIVGVLAEPRDGASLARLADGLGLPVLDAGLVRDPVFAEWMRRQDVDLLLNVHSLSIVHQEVTSAPRIGSFNLHPGPLPEYSGMNTVTWAIANGEASHAVTLHWMDAGVDTGHVAYARRFPIGEEDTGLTVFSRCVRLGVPLIFELLDTAAQGAPIPRQPQVGERRVYLRRDVPQAGRIAWSRTARELHDLIRASDFGPFPSPCGHPRARLGPTSVAMVSARRSHQPCSAPPGTIGDPVDGDAMVATADEWLAIRRVLVDGRVAGAAGELPPGRRVADGDPLA